MSVATETQKKSKAIPPNPSLTALLSQAVDYIESLEERLDAIGELAKVDAGEVLENAKVDLEAILLRLHTQPTDTFSGLFLEPSAFQQKGIAALEEYDIDPRDPANNEGYLRLFADLAATFCGLSREDQQSLTHTNGRDISKHRRMNKSLPHSSYDAISASL